MFALSLLASALPATPWSDENMSMGLQAGLAGGGGLLLLIGVLEIRSWQQRDRALRRDQWLDGELVVEEDVAGRYPACTARFEAGGRCWRMRCFTSSFENGHPLTGDRHAASACLDEDNELVVLEVGGREVIPAVSGCEIEWPEAPGADGPGETRQKV
ncbi:hypothetical protein ACFCW2_08515 [Qipengyuania sp. DSG2-2]|uniref:hypothetical protein n=1 Tax=Qipengyuania sp. DGS2-2 TaxID=3349631 RepID=UPI0036D24254